MEGASSLSIEIQLSYDESQFTLPCLYVQQLMQTPDNFEYDQCSTMMQLLNLVFALILNSEQQEEFIEPMVAMSEEV